MPEEPVQKPVKLKTKSKSKLKPELVNPPMRTFPTAPIEKSRAPLQPQPLHSSQNVVDSNGSDNNEISGLKAGRIVIGGGRQEKPTVSLPVPKKMKKTQRATGEFASMGFINDDDDENDEEGDNVISKGEIVKGRVAKTKQVMQQAENQSKKQGDQQVQQQTERGENSGQPADQQAENTEKNTGHKPETHVIDDRGDLLLVVTAGPRIHKVFCVDSRALARSSEFWNQLISNSRADMITQQQQQQRHQQLQHHQLIRKYQSFHTMQSPRAEAAQMSPCTALFSRAQSGVAATNLPAAPIAPAGSAGPDKLTEPVAAVAPAAHMGASPVVRPGSTNDNSGGQADYSHPSPADNSGSNSTTSGDKKPPQQWWYPADSGHRSMSTNTGANTSTNTDANTDPGPSPSSATVTGLGIAFRSSPLIQQINPPPGSPMNRAQPQPAMLQRPPPATTTTEAQYRSQTSSSATDRFLGQHPQVRSPWPTAMHYYHHHTPAMAMSPAQVELQEQLPHHHHAPPWTIILDLADQKAHVSQLSTLLHAAHGRLDRVPMHLTLGEFCSVLVLANRCAMVPIMRGHIHTWLGMAMVSTEADNVKGAGEAEVVPTSGDGTAGSFVGPGIPPALFTQLRIYWEVGMQDAFREGLGQLVWHTQLKGRSGDELASIQQNSRMPWPVARAEVMTVVTDLMETIRSHRVRIIAATLHLLQSRIVLLHSPAVVYPTGGATATATAAGTNVASRNKKKRSHEESFQDTAAITAPPKAIPGVTHSCTVGGPAAADCDAFHYGLLVQELGRRRIDPFALPEPAAVRKSPHALCTLFEEVHDAIDARMRHTVRATGRKFLGGHEHCNPLSSVIVYVKNMRDNDVAVLTAAQAAHLQMQSAKMGQKYNYRV